MNAITTTLSFQGAQFKPVTRDNQLWLRLPEIEDALGYAAKGRALAKIYAAHADEFTATMTKVIKVMTAGGKQAIRFFSLRGAHLLAMFARTDKAKAFRVWVLDTLDREVADLQARATAGERLDELTKRGIEGMCTHLEYLRSWWERFRPGIKGLNDRAATNVHDHFTHGVTFARSVAKELGLKSDRAFAEDCPWEGGYTERTQYVMKSRGAA